MKKFGTEICDNCGYPVLLRLEWEKIPSVAQCVKEWIKEGYYHP